MSEVVWVHPHILHHCAALLPLTKDKDRRQRIIRFAEMVTGCNLPPLQDVYAFRTLRWAGKIVADPSHPGHKLFETLPSGKRLRPISTKTTTTASSWLQPASSARPGPRCHWLLSCPTHGTSYNNGKSPYLTCHVILMHVWKSLHALHFKHCPAFYFRIYTFCSFPFSVHGSWLFFYFFPLLLFCLSWP